MTHRPNILLIVTDEERSVIPRPDGFSLPARERLAARGTTFERFYSASAMCSSARSVLYTGQHLPVTEIYDNDNMPYIRPLDPGLGTLGTMLRSAGYYSTYQGKWHLSNAYVTPERPGSTKDALEPYGFSEFNDWGDIDGGAWAGLKVDPMIAGQAVRWLRDRAPVVAADQPWFMAVNFVNPHDIMSFDYGGSPRSSCRSVSLTRWSPRRRPTSPCTGGGGTSSCPAACTTTCRARPPRWPSSPACSTRCSVPSPMKRTGTTA
ncbi:sulfatase-like hydrolase/transferase [Streptomyces sp. NPDC056549]|uniref:sulfatase-like hydrolase/transferase n=1 Tax=Streptomyces sp. NPDC056549 TaxID=3345864 RepID=UPI0036B05952